MKVSRTIQAIAPVQSLDGCVKYTVTLYSGGRPVSLTLSAAELQSYRRFQRAFLERAGVLFVESRLESPRPKLAPSWTHIIMERQR